MKSNLVLCALMLGGSMFVAAQQPATSPSSSTPPTFPTDQQSQAPGAAQPASPDQSQAPSAAQPASPDVNAAPTGSQSGSMDSSASAKSTEGCLSQATSGNGFILTDQSGVEYTLQGQTADLSSHVGQQVRVKGDIAPSTSAAANTDNPDSKGSTSASSSTSTSSSSTNPSVINVTSVKKIASSCTTSQNPSSK